MKNLENKKVLFLGDSITAGAAASAENKRFVNVFGEISGAEVYNYGIGGTRLAKQITPSKVELYDRYFLSRVPEMASFADFVVVFGGTNDYGHGDAPLGKSGDKTSDTFYGAVYELLTVLKEKYPKAGLLLVTPLHRVGESDTVNEYGLPAIKTLGQVVQAEKEVAKKLGVPVLDLYNCKDLNALEKTAAEKYISPDGLHPNDAGHRRIAEEIYKELNK